MKKKERRLEKRKKKKEVPIKGHKWWEYAGLWAMSIVFLVMAEDLFMFLFLKCADILLYFSPMATKSVYISLE